MMLLRFLEVLLVLLAILAVVTQVVLPVIRGQKLFPIFSKQAKLEETLAEAVQEKEEEKIQSTINKLKGKK